MFGILIKIFIVLLTNIASIMDDSTIICDEVIDAEFAKGRKVRRTLS